MKNPDVGRTGTSARMAVLLWIATLSTAAARSDAQAPAPAPPEVMQQRDIERALSAPRTRGLRIAPRPEPMVADEPGDPAQPVAGVGAGAGAATAGTGAALAQGTALPLPAAAASIALDIPFEINSSALRPAAARQISQLASALRSETLASYRFLIAGHTDATGDAAYNRKLSGRRADSVRRRLIDAGVAAERLDARGFGEDELLDPAHPNVAANRRVEIRNLGVPAQ